MQNNLWLGCNPYNCLGSPCPRMFFEGYDWIRCYGEIFQIVKTEFHGPVKSGDSVHLYYVHDKKWFSVYGGRGHKEFCTYIWSLEGGFKPEDRLFVCNYEIFIVYAKGKRVGEAITDQDTLSFYNDIENSYVQFLNDRVILSQCMLEKSGNSRPPTDAAFDECISDSVEIAISNE